MIAGQVISDKIWCSDLARKYEYCLEVSLGKPEITEWFMHKPYCSFSSLGPKNSSHLSPWFPEQKESIFQNIW